MAPGRFDWNFKLFMLILLIGGWDIFSEIALRRKSEGLTDDKSTLGQVMAWRHQATSYYLSQCWTRSKMVKKKKDKNLLDFNYISLTIRKWISRASCYVNVKIIYENCFRNLVVKIINNIHKSFDISLPVTHNNECTRFDIVEYHISTETACLTHTVNILNLLGVNIHLSTWVES